MPDASPFRSILVGTDGSATAGTAVTHAINLARELGAKLVFVSAFEQLDSLQVEAHPLQPTDHDDWPVGKRAEVLTVLAQAEADARAAGVTDVATFERLGSPADAILDVASEQACDLIVVGNRGMQGARRLLLGSVPNKISHAAPCSVLIVRTS